MAASRRNVDVDRERLRGLQPTRGGMVIFCQYVESSAFDRVRVAWPVRPVDSKHEIHRGTNGGG